MTDEMADNDRQRDQWVTIPQAAEILGRSTRTVRRYVTQGKLEADKSETPMLVNVADMVTDTGGQVADTGGQRVQELTETIERLEAEAQDLRGKVDRLALENRELDATNRELQRGIERLELENSRLWESHRYDQINLNELAKAAQGRPSILDRLLPWRGGDDE